MMLMLLHEYKREELRSVPKVVLDTNIFISGIFWNGTPNKVLKLADSGKMLVFVSLEILNEVEDVLIGDFKLSKEMAHRRLDYIKGIATAILPSMRLDIVKDDPDDNKVLECAVACGADYIITGDKHLLTLKDYNGIQIITAATLISLAHSNSKK